jgi:FkbM family methyltransferase
LIRDAISERLPRSLRVRRWIRQEMRTGEPELRLVGQLMKDSGAVVDVGANAGIYSAIALQRRRWVTAFEPVPAEAARLRWLIGTQGVVHQVALSDHAGKAILHVPYTSEIGAVTTRSSLEAEVDADLPHRDIEVEVATLDSFELPETAFIKIDVEGHELAVLNGAVQTIKCYRPNLLVEVEESRAPGCFQAVSDFFAAQDYRGCWLDGEELRSIEHFQLAVHQVNRPKAGERKLARYINNFIWLPNG